MHPAGCGPHCWIQLDRPVVRRHRRLVLAQFMQRKSAVTVCDCVTALKVYCYLKCFQRLPILAFIV